MPTLSITDRLTAAEAMKRGGFTDDQRTIIEVMSTTNELLYDAPVAQANMGTVHTQTKRTALPHGTHRKYNQGVKPSASQTGTIRDIVTELSAYSEVDARLVQHQVDSQAFLTNECLSFIEGMGQDQAEDMIYGDSADPDAGEIDGLAKRRSKIDTKDNLVINAGGSGNNLTSLYLVKWGPHGVQYIYPRGATGLGVKRKDRGIQDIEVFDANGNRQGKMPAYVNYFSCEYGLSVGDPRSLIRIANIDPNMDGTELVKIVVKAMNNLMPGGGTVSILANKDIKTMFDIAAMEKNNVIHTLEDPWGRPVTHIREARLRRCDAISSAESAIS